MITQPYDYVNNFPDFNDIFMQNTVICKAVFVRFIMNNKQFNYMILCYYSQNLFN